jgi:AAA ATPase-like protein
MFQRTADPQLEGSGTLVGRRAECEVIDQALERLANGGSQVIELTGDPGTGKTRLLAELARRAGERGLLVLEGRAQHRGGRVPFYALVDALDDHLAAMDADVREADRDVLGSAGAAAGRGGAPCTRPAAATRSTWTRWPAGPSSVGRATRASQAAPPGASCRRPSPRP